MNNYNLKLALWSEMDDYMQLRRSRKMFIAAYVDRILQECDKPKFTLKGVHT